MTVQLSLVVREKAPGPCLPLRERHGSACGNNQVSLEEFSLKINLWDGVEAQFEPIPTEGIVFSGKYNRKRLVCECTPKQFHIKFLVCTAS